MAPETDRDSSGDASGPVPVGTAHQVSGPWEMFGPGGLEGAVGRRADGPLVDPLAADDLPTDDLPTDALPSEDQRQAGRGQARADEGQVAASRVSGQSDDGRLDGDDPVDRARATGSDSTRDDPGGSPVPDTDGRQSEQGDGGSEWQRVPVHQHVAGIDPADAPKLDSDRADDPPDDGPEADPESVARTIVLRKLTAQDRTRAELADALRAKDVPDQVAHRVLDRMEEVGLVDDARFADAWVRSRQQRRGMSALALRRELNRKGVDPDLTDAALDQVDPDDEYTAALALAEKKFRTMGGLQPDVAKRRLAGALARRGFGSGLVWRVVREVLGETH